MKPPLANFLITLAGAFLIFVGLGVHPSFILITVGCVLSLAGMMVRFEKRKDSGRG